jgi:molybdopterin adenylyltransferase
LPGVPSIAHGTPEEHHPEVAEAQEEGDGVAGILQSRDLLDDLVARGPEREIREGSNHITVGIITISDRASAGDYEDLGGPAVKQAAQKAGWQVLAEAIVPDDATRIQETIRSFGKQGCGLILTTGGTGIGPRDVTPEAIRAMMRVELPGFGEVMRAESMKITPNAILSRNLAAVVDHALVIALPGKPSGAVECLSFVQSAIPHGVAVAQGTPTSC